MPQIVCNITLDVSLKGASQVFMAKRGDSKSRLLQAQLTDCGRELPIEGDATVLLNLSRAGESHAFAGAVTDGGQALFVLPDFALAEVGSVKGDVSVLGIDGARLTSCPFEISVEDSVCPDAEVNDPQNENLMAELLAREVIIPLEPQATENGFVLAPEVNHKYSVDLSDAQYAPEGAWLPISLQLPAVEMAEKEHWVLIYCHAPVRGEQGALVMDWGAVGDCVFADGQIPFLTMSDFDIICTYSPAAGRWQIGVIQYGAAEGGV